MSKGSTKIYLANKKSVFFTRLPSKKFHLRKPKLNFLLENLIKKSKLFWNHRHNSVLPKSISEQLLQNKDLYRSYFTTDTYMNWCDGCGNYAIQEAMVRALTLENIPPKNVVLAYDVGCNGNASDKLAVHSFHGLHGRVLPLAEWIHLGNPDLTVIAHAGDGATFWEGINHLVHAVRNDYSILFIHHNNQNYALTTGQSSPTTQKEPHPIDPVAFVLWLDPGCVLRSHSDDLDHMTQMIQLGLGHDGFVFLDIVQACPKYNKDNTKENKKDAAFGCIRKK